MRKIIIYQALTRLFGNKKCVNKEFGTIKENGAGKMDDFSDEVLDSLHSLGFTHIWFTGVIRHASKTIYKRNRIPESNPEFVKGIAGSPYAICDYYDINPDIAKNVSRRMSEFCELLERTHKMGMKAIIDFVPNHVAAEYNGTFKPFTDENYYPGHIHDGDWTDTAKLNYASADTRQKMIDILLFWAGKGVDGFRCDMAELVPVDFWSYAVKTVKKQFPEIIFIGEVYNPYLYRDFIATGGFDYLYDKVGMYDTMKAVIQGRTPASQITAAWQQVGDIYNHMLYFLENHDEQRIACDYFAGDAKKALPAVVINLLMRGNPFMIYMGQTLGEKALEKAGYSGVDGRTTIYDYWSLGTLRRWLTGSSTEYEHQLHSLYKKILDIAANETVVADGKFFDLMYVNPTNNNFDAGKQYAFIRKNDNSMLLVCANFSDRDVNVKVRIPTHAFEYLEISEGRYKAENLLNGEKKTFMLTNDGMADMNVPANFAAVWKMVL